MLHSELLETARSITVYMIHNSIQQNLPVIYIIIAVKQKVYTPFGTLAIH